MPQLLDKELFQDQRVTHRTLFYQLWLHMFNASLFIAGGILFTIGSLLFYDEYGQPRSGAWCFLIGSCCFFSGAAQDWLELRCALSSPDSDGRLLSGDNDSVDEEPDDKRTCLQQCLFDHSAATRLTIVSLYMLADLLFIGGSWFFFPKAHKHLDVGLWLFIIGSIIYVIGMLWDILWTGAHRHLRKHYSDKELLIARVLNTINLGCYIIGCILFVPGCFDDFPSRHNGRRALDLFLAGSICFTVGAVTAMAKRAYFRPKVQVYNVLDSPQSA
eukprot:TRINITY_DN5522_c0_g1_i2.p1 TRINITY_DN5522_c0_g1~~TRINITY_DN5522_c0_g1_i2.p1  ORF type:complete len:273 (+),score=41.79 TRINITY_DN5522_c0_g1_i2:148-966(+)